MSKYGRLILPLLVLSAVVSSCFPTTSLYDVDLSEWNADSENVTELRVLIENQREDNQTVIFVSNRPQSGQLEDKTFDIWQMKRSL